MTVKIQITPKHCPITNVVTNGFKVFQGSMVPYMELRPLDQPSSQLYFFFYFFISNHNFIEKHKRATQVHKKYKRETPN
jgi:hypothetical protein